MPNIDGVETIRRIQTDSALATTPMCMMVTAHSREEVLRQVQDSGVNIDGLLIKPVAPSTLYDSIMMALGNDTGPGTHQRSERGVRADVARALSGAHILLVEDNDMNREVALEILGRAGIQVDVASNGKEALEKIDRVHYDGVLMDCHEFNELPLDSEVRLNVYVCNSILSTMVYNGKIDKAFRLFEQLKSEGLKPDTVTYSTVGLESALLFD